MTSHCMDRQHRSVSSFGLNMPSVLAILALVALALCAIGADAPSKPVLSFSLAATNDSFARAVGRGLTLRVERDQLGWEVGVFHQRSTENLLYPQRNWHGAYPCQLTAWSHRTRTFPDRRIIPVRGMQLVARVRLVGVAISGRPGREKFAAGSAEIYLEPK